MQDFDAFYSTPSVNMPVELYNGPVTVNLKDKAYTGNGRIELHWLPTPSVRYQLFPTGLESDLGIRDGVMKIPNAQKAVKVAITHRSISLTAGEAQGFLAGRLSDSLTLGGGSNLATIIFHTPNFHDFSPSPATVVCQGWKLSIERAANIDTKFLESLRDLTGFAITHVGTVEHDTKDTFTCEEGREILDCLTFFLWFCRGVRAGAILPIGLNSSDEQVWQEWRDWNVDRYHCGRNWFNDQSSTGITDVLPGYLARWESETWREPLKVALHWYVESNKQSGGIEGAIVLIQAAFELLSWTLLVEDLQMISEDGFSKLPASDKLRLLVSSAKIPLAFPTALLELQSLAKANNWKDGPQGIVETRNAIVHPNPDMGKKLRTAGFSALYECWNLSLWYFELVLLSLFGYQGMYSNRLIRGVYKGEEVERVPWAVGG